ncbi:hypothetical protein ABZ672_04075 [Streptomyces mirabilis]
MNVTCRTVGCPVVDVTYTVDMYSNAEPPTYRALCEQCKHPVTDLVPYTP